MPGRSVINILMADDDPDDRYYFKQTLKKLPINFRFTTVDDGVHLMEYLTRPYAEIPDILFLDINMPRKNGYECLIEIKEHQNLSHLPIIIYSTSPEGTMADLLYDKGANYYLRKGELDSLETSLMIIFALLKENNIQRPIREEFVINGMNVT